MQSSHSLRSAWLTVITDLVVLAVVCFLPAISHLGVGPVKLYYLDPMRLLLFSSLLITNNKKNALVLAVALPLFSTLVIHHPPFFKALLISIELLVNLSLFVWMLKKYNWPPVLIFILTTVVSKVFYYLFKYIFIQLSLVDGELITTSLWIQAGTVLFLAILFGLFSKREKVI